jgi:hypothetical protein
MPTEPTARDPIAGLHRGEPESHAFMKRWCGESIDLLVDRLRARHHLGRERQHWIEVLARAQHERITALTIRYQHEVPAGRGTADVPV